MKPLLLPFFLALGPLLGAQSALGHFDNYLPVGLAGQPATASYLPEDQTYTLRGSGARPEAAADRFHYLWTTTQGDFILRAEGRFLGTTSGSDRELGWIVKNDLRDHTITVRAGRRGDGTALLRGRPRPGVALEGGPARPLDPEVLQLERRGDWFIFSAAPRGETLVEVGRQEVVLNHEVYVGLFLDAGGTEAEVEARFRNVRIVTPAQETPGGRRDYLSSYLEVMEVETGHRRILHRSEHSIQAPNWTLDGQSLIYNSKGHLYTYDLASGRIRPLPTGELYNNNNDHVLSFDGRRLGISNNEPEHGGTSTIYYLALEPGAEPVRVTRPESGASYLHGWSPSGDRLVFTGRRNGQFDIYAADLRRGEEIQLTNLPSLDDGPEYSPDGAFIYFNSVRTGTMQLYRMRPDGSEVEQLTFDGLNDWFPHLSPDGRQVVFISFPQDIDPSTHPFYKRCLLRLMPAEGGTPRVIAYVYGGQGSINVPSWSPDGKYIAFVTNGGK